MYAYNNIGDLFVREATMRQVGKLDLGFGIGSWYVRDGRGKPRVRWVWGWDWRNY